MNPCKLFLCFAYFISVYPDVKCELCCSNRDTVLNGTDLNSSRLIISLRAAILPGVRNMSYNFRSDTSQYMGGVNALINTKLKPIIEMKNITNDDKHNRIVKELLEFIETYEGADNKSRTICIPINHFGYLGDYIECEVNDTKIDTKLPSYKLKCSKYFSERPYWYIDGPSCHKSYCCENITMLLSADKANDSILISSFYKVFQSPNSYKFPFMFSARTQSNWTDMMTNFWIPIIQNSTLYNYTKHKQIYKKSVKFMTDLDLNMTVMVCTPLDDWGYFGDYLQCIANDFHLVPSKALECAAQFGWTQTWMMKEKPCFRNETKKAEPVDACCSNRRYLLNIRQPFRSILITSIETAINSMKQNANYPFYWEYATGEAWKKMMFQEWTGFIKDKTTTYVKKFQLIYNASIKEIDKIYNNKSPASCFPIGEWGYFGDFLQCTVNFQNTTAPAYKLRCRSWFGEKQNWMLAVAPCKKDYCCDNITQMFQYTDLATANKSKAVVAVYESLTSTTYKLQSKWTNSYKKNWRTEMDKWLVPVGAAAATEPLKRDKLKAFFDLANNYLKAWKAKNISHIVCAPVSGFGHFGDIMQCIFDKNYPNTEPEWMMTCPEYIHGQIAWREPPVPCPVVPTISPDCCTLNATVTAPAVVTNPTNHCLKILAFNCSPSATGKKAVFTLTAATSITVQADANGVPLILETECLKTFAFYKGANTTAAVCSEV